MGTGIGTKSLGKENKINMNGKKEAMGDKGSAAQEEIVAFMNRRDEGERPPKKCGEDLRKEEELEAKLYRSKKERGRSAWRDIKGVSIKTPLVKIEQNEDAFLIDQMKVEIKRLYGEKVNMINTHYIIKPQEFSGMARMLESTIWGADRARKRIETVDDLAYAIDALCHAKDLEACGCKEVMSQDEIRAMKEKGMYAKIKDLFEQSSMPKQETSIEEAERAQVRLVEKIEAERDRELLEIYSSLRYIGGSMRPMVDSALEQPERALECVGKCIVQGEIESLMETKERLGKWVERSKYSSVEQMVHEKEKSARTLERVKEDLGLFIGEDVLKGISRVRKEESDRLDMEVKNRERNMDLQKRHYEEELSKLRVRIVDLEIDNKKLKRLLKERVEVNEEVKERSGNLEEGIQNIKRALEEESRRNESERQSFDAIRRKLIERNRELAGLIKELVKRIKSEKKDLEMIEETREDLKEMM